MMRSLTIGRYGTILLIFFILFASGCENETTDSETEPSDNQQLALEHSVSWSPDSAMVAVISNSSLIVQTAKTDDLRQLTGTGFYSEPDWSPDSTRIAYSSRSLTTRDDIWIKNADGSGIAKRITSDIAADLYPRWSPDGKLISFNSYRKKSMDIWVRNSDGSGEDILVVTDPAVDQNAEWSPDGTRLAFESKRAENFDIWVAKLDGSTPPLQITSETSADTEPLWSPDGKRIAFQSDRDSVQGIWVKNSDGTWDAVCVSSGYSNASLHDWSSDSKWIAFVSEFNIIVKKADGTGDAIKIGNGTEPRWSPDGTRMAFISNSESQYKVQIIDLPDELKRQ